MDVMMLHRSLQSLRKTNTVALSSWLENLRIQLHYTTAEERLQSPIPLSTEKQRNIFLGSAGFLDYTQPISAVRPKAEPSFLTPLGIRVFDMTIEAMQAERQCCCTSSNNRELTNDSTNECKSK
jgi:hypothetical protein